MNWNAVDKILLEHGSSEPLVRQGDGAYQLTEAGFFLVTKLLEDLKYFPADIDMDGFESNKHWAGIIGTHMVEAAGKFMSDCKGQELDDDQAMILSLVALYSAIAEAQVKESESAG